jgi:hypothetical protein
MTKNPGNENLVQKLGTKFPPISGNQASPIVKTVVSSVNIRSGPYPSPEDYD